MGLPADVDTLKVELYQASGGAWTDVTSSVILREGIKIQRGRRAEGQSTDPTSCSLTFKNAAQDFSPRNPTGAYYGDLTRNTPLRVSTLPSNATSRWFAGPGNTGTYMSCPDSAGISITGDIDIRADLVCFDWGASKQLVSKYDQFNNPTQKSYDLGIDWNSNKPGHLTLSWSANGTTGIHVDSTIPLPKPWYGRKAIRATLDVNNGSGGYTVTFYTADTINGSWTQLGDAIATTSGTTSIYDGNQALSAGFFSYVGEYYALKVLEGIGGTERANPDFTAQSDGATSFSDSAGNTWTRNFTNLDSGIRRRSYRAWAEVSEWPQQWNHAESAYVVPVTASGILRRLTHGSSPNWSAYRRAVHQSINTSGITTISAYWPMEDASGSTQFATDLPAGGNPLVPASLTGVQFANDSSFVSSGSIATITNVALAGRIQRCNASYTGGIRTMMMIDVPSGGTTNGGVICRLLTTGTVVRWELTYQTTGDLVLHGYNSAGTSVLTSATAPANLDGDPAIIGFDLVQNGADIDYAIVYGTRSNSWGYGGLNSITGTLASNSIVYAKHFEVNTSSNLSIGIGHIMVEQGSITVGSYDQDKGYAFAGHPNETAATRLARLCSEENIDYATFGYAAGTQRVGLQSADSFLNLIKECEAADGGMLIEPRDWFGLAYLTVDTMQSQDTVRLALDYATAGDITGLEPTDDDQLIHNDVTVSRRSGSSARASLSDSSALGWDTIGVYDTSLTVNVELDSDLTDRANWELHKGTYDAPRFSSVAFTLSRSQYTGSKLLSALALDTGDIVTLSNPPAALAPDQVELNVQGITEIINSGGHSFDLNCIPNGIYHGLVYSRTGHFWAPYDAAIYGSATAGATSIPVQTISGIVFAHNDGDYDIICLGERMTVTGVGTGTVLTDDFESGIGNWTANGSTIAAEASTVHGGSGSMQITSTAVANPRAETVSYYRAFGGNWYTVSGWLRCTAAIAIQLDAYWYTPGAVFVSSSSNSISVSANTWTSFSANYQAPASVDALRLAAGFTGTPTAGRVMFVDDVSVTAMAGSTPQLLTVTRAVNGVSKALTDTAEVKLFTPRYWGL